MKLFYAPGACSLAPHIVANEADLAVEFVKVDGSTKKTEHGEDFLAISPNGYVPALQLADGTVLTEAQVLVQYLADQKPESGLMPAAGELDRYRVQQLLAFISSELHKAFGPFFKPGTPEETKAANLEHLNRRFAFVDQQLEGKTYLTGETFTAADAYLWTILGWTKFIGLDVSSFANLSKFIGTVAQRPAVQKALKEEGLA